MEWYFFPILGAAVGFIVGITGVGGGSLMTPILLATGIPPHIAVGTDLLYAAVTKGGGAISSHRNRHIEWSVVRALALGSVPACLITVGVLHFYPVDYGALLKPTLGIMLILTALVILGRYVMVDHLRQFLKLKKSEKSAGSAQRPVSWRVTLLFGIFIGVMVTLTSVGAGAICSAVLLILFPLLSSRIIVGTDIAHAVPLTLLAGLGHWYLGNVDWLLLFGLLLGSLPAIHFGVQVGTLIPDKIMRAALSLILLGIGLKYCVSSLM